MMVKVFLIGAAALLASARFVNTVTLGTVLVSVLIVIGFAWATRNDKRSERWEKLYDLADTERKEIQSKLEEMTELVKHQKDVITKLDALQMPVRIVELMNQSVTRIDDAARQRLESALEEVKSISNDHELNAEDRSNKVLAKLDEIVNRLPPVVHGGL